MLCPQCFVVTGVGPGSNTSVMKGRESMEKQLEISSTSTVEKSINPVWDEETEMKKIVGIQTKSLE